ncbi:hypothetical protein BN2476_1090009 [Paraburkholderia piptadeniae]|uniref:Uncharacterized protein n=1 Tax=Paraburkholderia piptadeniae TaxID=1701573 RepID=A0A1N7SUV4_9BURK|nr:hypothetical protein BN2476_1090009 [Paraburkholderia piptadeniae]
MAKYGARSDMPTLILNPHTGQGRHPVVDRWKNTPAIMMSEKEHGHCARLSCSFDADVPAI